MSEIIRDKLNAIVNKYFCKLLDESQAKDTIIIDTTGFLKELKSLYAEEIDSSILNFNWLNEFEPPQYYNIVEASKMIRQEVDESVNNGNELLAEEPFLSFVYAFLSSINSEVEQRMQNREIDISEDRNAREQKLLHDINEDLLSLKERYDKIDSFIADTEEKIQSAVKSAKQAITASQEAKNASEEAKKAATEAKSTAQTVNTAVESISETANSILPNILTVVGIFIAMVIAVIVCYLSVVIAKHPNNSWSSDLFPIILGIVMGQIAINMVFLLLFLIGKLTNKSIAISCPEASQCYLCKSKVSCHIGNRAFRKYPYIIASNIIFAITIWLLSLLTVADLYFDDAITSFIGSHNIVTIILFLILLIIFLLGCYLFFFKNIIKKRNER